MEENPVEIPNQKEKKHFHIFKRFVVAVKGSFWRNVLRLFAGFFALIVLGLYGIICIGNFISNTKPAKAELAKAILRGLWFGIKRSAVLFWHLMSNLTSMDLAYNWGDLAMVIFTLSIVFIFIYCIISIPCDALDGDVADKCPMIWKILITLGVLIILSLSIFALSPKPEGDFKINANLFLDDYGREVCKTGEIPLFIPLGEHAFTIVEENITTTPEIQVI